MKKLEQLERKVDALLAHSGVSLPAEESAGHRVKRWARQVKSSASQLWKAAGGP